MLFLGAHDSWTTAVTQSDDFGAARITTSDTSCTNPPIPPEGVQLRSAGYDGTGTLPADGGPPDISRTREGMLEFIVGGDIAPGSTLESALQRAHHGEAPPCGNAIADFVGDLNAPTNGIYGSATIVNVTQGTFFGYNADALESLTKDVMFLPGNPYPGPALSDALTNEGAKGSARAYVFTNDGHALGLDYRNGIDAVSAVWMADSIYNEYVTSTSLGAQTDWVVTFPTKHFYVDSLYGTVPKPPFESAFDAS